MEKRRLLIYVNGNDRNGSLIASKEYNYTSPAQERQVADDICTKYNLRNGEGFFSVTDDKGCTLKKLEFQA